MVIKPFGKILLFGALTLALAGCVQVTDEEGGENTGATGEPVVVGALLPLSGEGAAYGLPAQRVLQIAMADVNAAGGIGGRPIKLEFDDGGCDSAPANRATENLVSIKKVKVIIGGFCSSETLAAAPIVEKNKVVLLSPASSSPKITPAGDYIFRNYPSDNAQGGALADYAAKKGYKKVGMLVEEQPYTEGIADAFSGAFSKNGGVTVVEKFANEASDFRTQITKLQAAKVDAYFVDPQAPATAGLLVKQLVEAGVKGPFFLNDVAIGSTEEVVKKYATDLEGAVGAEVPYDMANPAVAKLKEDYKKLANGEELPYITYMATTYDSLWIVKEALEKEGEDGEKLKNYLYAVKGRKGLSGTLSFDENGDPSADFRHALRMVKNGAVENYKE